MMTNNLIKFREKLKKSRRSATITFIVMFTILSIYPAMGVAYSPLTIIGTTQIPLFIKVFIVIMAILISLDIAMLSEIKKIVYSEIWDYLLVGHIFCFLTVITQASLMYRLYFLPNIPSSLHYLLTGSAIFYINTHIFIYFVLYYLINPIAKRKLNLFNIKYLLLYIISIAAIYGVTILNTKLLYPRLPKFMFFYLFALFLFGIIVYFCIVIFSISENYAKIGFVRKPFLFGGIGGTTFALSFILILFYCFKFLEIADLPVLYYYMSFYLVASLFAMIYHLKFIIDYPSLLEPKWKVLMPFDFQKAAAAITLAFLATSLFLTVKEYPIFSIYQNMPYPLVPLFLLPIFLGIILTFTYLKTLLSKTKLKYWRYLEYGQYVHITVTFYVFSLALLSWNDLARNTKLFCALFGLVAFAFYLCFALDLLTILKDQTIRPKFNRLDIVRYIVALSSTFALILFGISFAYDGASIFARVEIISYPLILFFIAFFLIAFGSYLSVTHKGFEEILGKNIWSELSYIFAFVIFILIYFIYISLNAHLQRFPYHNLAFIGYFAVLVIEIVSTKTLSEKFKYGKTRREDIVRLLNLHAHDFLRTDYLEALWGKKLDQNVAEDEVKNVGFDPSRRRFDLEKIDEKTRLTVAARMLLEMHKLPDVEKIRIQRGSLEETKEEIAGILKEKILMLPEDLRSEFDDSAYYPVLYERVINDLLIPLKTFIPFSEQRTIFERLERREALFTSINFEVDEIRLKEETKFSRDDFLKLFRLYIEAIEEQFPFKRFLLYELVRDEIKRELERYNIGVSEVLNIVPMGVEGMDKIMAGGLMKGSTTLLITEETKTKQKILLAFIEQGLVEGSFAIYATSKRPFHQIVGEILMDAEDLRNLMILDFYEDLYTEDRISELVEDENRIIVPLNKILYQRSIVKAIKSQPKEAPKIVIIDVYDEFSRSYSPDEIFVILQKQIEGLKRWNCTSVIILDPQSHLIKKEGVDNVKKHFENVMILSGEDKASSAFIEKLYHGTPSKHIIPLPW